MSGGIIFLVGQSSEDLTPMQEEPYSQEDIIQKLLAKYPDLLAGDQITPDAPRRWLLVKREMDVPDQEGGSGRWSLDHLFVDQDGIPTFVECKRALDTRGRREVVAQMLDYAANGIAYWSIDRIRQAAAATAVDEDTSLDTAVRRLLDADVESELDADAGLNIDTFWRTVESNLRSGTVRLIFVAEETPPELRRLVEFLNEKLQGVEVLAIEVKQYLGRDQQVLVPRLVGMTAAARTKNDETQPRRRRMSREDFLARCSDAARPTFEMMLKAAEDRSHVINRGTSRIALRAKSAGGRLFTYAYCWPPSQYDVYFGDWPPNAQQIDTIRARLLSTRLFTTGGEFTLHCAISADTANAIQTSHLSLLDDVTRIASAS